MDPILKPCRCVVLSLLGTILLLASDLLLAQSEDLSPASALPSTLLPSTLSVEGGGDEQGSRDHYLGVDYGLRSGTRLLVSLAGSRSENQDN